jgi:hypothetical protein
MQFEFSLSELTTILIKDRELHDGVWMPAFEFTFGAMHAGPSPAEVRPAALVQISKINLVRVPDGMPPDFPLAVDAAKVNPAPKVAKASATKASAVKKPRSKAG